MSNETGEPRLAAPDHTRIQIAAVVQAVIAVAVAFGVDISDEQSVALIALAGVLGTVLIGADAAIRRERARNADKLRPQAAVTATQTPAGTQVEAQVTGPVDQLKGEESELDEAVVELLRRILEARTEPEPGTEPQPVGRAPARSTRSRPRKG
jgi:hypothetical protein